MSAIPQAQIHPFGWLQAVLKGQPGTLELGRIWQRKQGIKSGILLRDQ